MASDSSGRWASALARLSSFSRVDACSGRSRDLKLMRYRSCSLSTRPASTGER